MGVGNKKRRKKGGRSSGAEAETLAKPVSAKPAPAPEAEADEGAPAEESVVSDEAAAEVPSLESAPEPRQVEAMAAPLGRTPFDLGRNRGESAQVLIQEANQAKAVSVYFEDETFVTYESSRIPWWVRLFWIGFWLLAFFYITNNLWPDAQRYFAQ